MKYYLTQAFSLWSVMMLAAEGKNKKILKTIDTKLNNVLDALNGLQNQREDIHEQLGRIESFMHTLNRTCCSAIEEEEEPSNTVHEWVSRVTDFSSQYNTNSWSANQVVGEPNVYPSYGDLHGTWASKVKDANQFIELEFPEAIYVTGIDIYETYHAGGVKAISGKGESSPWHTLWSTDQVEVITNSRIFSPPLQIPDFSVKYIRIDVDCTASRSWVEIDAVKLKGTMTNPNV